jgi:outer membrane protein assembly factor BamB
MSPRLALLVALLLALASTTASADGNPPSVKVGRGPCCLAFVGGNVFVGIHRGLTIVEVSPKTNKIIWRDPRTDLIDYGALVGAFGRLWIGDDGTLERLDPRTHKRAAVHHSGTVDGFVPLGRSIWASAAGSPWLRRINPAKAKVVGRIRVAGVKSAHLAAAGDGSLWLDWINQFHSVDIRIDAKNGKELARLQPFAPDAEVRSTVLVGHSLWQAQPASSAGNAATVVRIDTDTNTIAQTFTPEVSGDPESYPVVLGAGDGTLWLQTGPASIMQLDPDTGAVLRTVAIPLPAGRDQTDYYNSVIAYGAGAYWVTVWPGIDLSTRTPG